MDRTSFLQNGDRVAVEILDGHAMGIDAKVAIDGRQKITKADATVDDLLAAAIGGADDLTAGDPAAPEQHRSDARPMISPRLNGPRRRTGRAFAADVDIAEPANAKQEAFLPAISMPTARPATTRR